MKKLLRLLTCAFALTTCMVACSEEDGSEEEIFVESIVVYAESDTTIYLGKTLDLIADVTPSNATTNNVSWSSSNENAATVVTSGNRISIVTATSESANAGTVTITATAKDGTGITGTIDIIVTGDPSYEDD